MTATTPPADQGFFATLKARTLAAFWEHYGKVLQVFFAGLVAWAATYTTAWLGALPTPAAPPPVVQTQPRPEPLSTAGLEAIINRLDSRLEKVLTELVEANKARKRSPPKSP